MAKTKTYIHTYAMLLMGERGFSQTSLAAKAKVTVVTVNQILLGKRTSAPVQLVIASSLGYESWELFENAAVHFSDLFALMYNRPTKRPEANDVDRHENAV